MTVKKDSISHASRVNPHRQPAASRKPRTARPSVDPAKEVKAAITESREHVPSAVVHHDPAVLPSAEGATHAPAKKRFLGLVLGLVIVILLAALGMFTLGVYRLGLQGAWVDTVLAAVPLPVATANGGLISYHTYLEDLATLRYYFS
ncbi:MAG: hypothetical protein HY566_02575, partial [Candidatus Kerfeldbacteria bacterium]|nr:hypothetical protein [Candidatus Kerfeldbacteria bacterium]